jgi:hypothetical protein
MRSKIRINNGQAGDMGFIQSKAFVDYATTKMCDGHNRICVALENDLAKKNIFISSISPDTNVNDSLEDKIEFVTRTTEEHYVSISKAYKNVDNLIQYGLPADGFIGQIRDRISGNDEIKMKNEIIVDKILNSEADLDIINTYILPEIDIGIQNSMAQAIIEESEVKDQSELQFGELRHDDPYFFRRQCEAYVNARDAITHALSQMEEKEKALESNYKIKIEIDQKTATYIFTASWTSGDKSVQEDSKKIGENIEKTSRITKEKNRKERNIKIKIGQSSRSLYEEIRRQTACQFGYTYEQEVGTRNKTIRGLFSTRIADYKSMIRRKTKVAGKKEYEAKASFDAAKIEEKVVYVDKQAEEDKEKTLFVASVGAGNVSAGIDARQAIPTMNASAKAAGISAAIPGVAQVNLSAGSIGYNTDKNIVGDVKEAIFEHAVGADNSSVTETIQRIAAENLERPNNIYISGPSASARVEISDITILSASCDGEEIKTRNRIPEIVDAASRAMENAVEHITPHEDDLCDKNELREVIEFAVSEDDAIDMRVFDVDLGDMKRDPQEPMNCVAEVSEFDRV